MRKNFAIWHLYILDMNECKMNASLCPDNSTCINRAEPIKFTCNCNFGFGKVDKACHGKLADRNASLSVSQPSFVT